MIAIHGQALGGFIQPCVKKYLCITKVLATHSLTRVDWRSAPDAGVIMSKLIGGFGGA